MDDSPAISMPERVRRDDEHLGLLLTFCLRANSNCVDIGASSGLMLRQMVRLAPRGKHIAYEPIPGLAAALRAEFPEVDVREVALSHESGHREFKHVANLEPYSGFYERSYPSAAEIESITVETRRLDGDLPAGYAPDLIKIDVEGAEQWVVEGGLETITKYKPIVVFEWSSTSIPAYQTSPERFYEMLSSHAGLRIFDLDGNGPYTFDEFNAGGFDDANPVGHWNFVALPESRTGA